MKDSASENSSSEDEIRISFPAYLKRRKVLLKLIHQQTIRAQRHDLSFEDLIKSDSYKLHQQNRGDGDIVASETDEEVLRKVEQCNEDLISLEQILKFDSAEDMAEYKMKYTESIRRLVENEKDDDIIIHSQKRQGCGTMKEASFGNCLAKNFQCVKNYSKCWFSIIVTAVAFMVLFCLDKFSSSLIEPMFNAAEWIEWPWSVFMKEPLLKGFILF